MKKKLRIGVLFGGKSAEHDISLVSAKNIINALDKNKYSVTPVKIDKKGKFKIDTIKSFDVVFPVLHGPFGEDGSMQGLLKIIGVPFVGPSVLSSALGMDKDVMKRLFREAGIPVGKFLAFMEDDKISFEKVKQELGVPMFIKPANMGSSVGIAKVSTKTEFIKAVKNAFQYDRKIVIEKNVVGREIECAVLGNMNPKASALGEIIPAGDFYSYDAKYVDDSKTLTRIKLPLETTKKIQNLAIKVFKVLGCEGMGRVDFFLKKNGEVLVNEINTIPGFTSISMYPKLWEESGIPLPKLLENLIDLAIERWKKEQKLRTNPK
jgi:D-alanine-D-alanine ligase